MNYSVNKENPVRKNPQQSPQANHCALQTSSTYIKYLDSVRIVYPVYCTEYNKQLRPLFLRDLHFTNNSGPTRFGGINPPCSGTIDCLY